MHLLTQDLPGTGGLFKASPEDFVVDELPAYPPSGVGTHTFLRIEKRGLTTAAAVARLCRALEVAPQEAGIAGQKDRQALTRQWISLPGIEPARALALELPEVRVLSAERHGHKLRTGHLTGNRFSLVLRGVMSEAATRARAILDRLIAHGLPNYYGAQRFGARGDNAARGKALLTPAPKGRRASGAERRLLVSAYQAELFNRYLDQRIDDGSWSRALVGDVLKKRDSGGLFIVDEAAQAEAQGRLDAQKVVVTGPMFGHKMMAPPAGTPAAAREAAILAAEGIDTAAFAILGKLAEGTRRPLLVPIGAPDLQAGPDPDSLRLEFTLPAGAYATVLLGEVMK